MANSVSNITSEEPISFDSLADAVSKANSGDTLQLNEDIEGVSSYVIIRNKDLTIDLAGHTYSANTYTLVVGSNGNVTLIDSSEAQTGWLKSTNKTCIQMQPTSTGVFNNSFTLKSGNIEAYEFGITTFGGATVNIEGGTVTSLNNAALGSNGSAQFAQYPCTYNISGGTLTSNTITEGYANCGLYAANSGDYNVAGGTIIGTSGAGIVLRAGNLNITGGNIIGKGNSEGLKMGDANPTYCGGIEICNASNYPGQMGKCYISGGTVISENNSAILVIGDPTDESTPNAINSSAVISGGTFNSKKAAINYITKDNELIDDASTANLNVINGSFSSDVSRFVASGIETTQVTNPDGSISYVVEDQEGKLVENTNQILEGVTSLHEDLASTNSELETLNTKVNTTNTKLTSIDTRLNTANTKIDTINSRLNTTNTKLDSTNTKLDAVSSKIDSTKNSVDAVQMSVATVNSSVASTNSKLDELSNQADTLVNSNQHISDALDTVQAITNIMKSDVASILDDTASIDSTTSEISNTASAISQTTSNIDSTTQRIDSTTNLIKTELVELNNKTERVIEINKKILGEVVKLLGGDPSSLIETDPAASTPEGIELLMLKSAISNAQISGETSIIWQHPLSETIEAYCKSAGYVVAPAPSVNSPAKLGEKWLIIFSE